MRWLSGSCDFARDIAIRYLLNVIMTLFGVPDTDYDTMLRHTQALMETQDPDSGSPVCACPRDGWNRR